MAKFKAGNSPKPKNQGSSTPPPKGYLSNQSSAPGGKPVGMTPGKGGVYNGGVHVGGIGGTGTSRGVRKPWGGSDAC